MVERSGPPAVLCTSEVGYDGPQEHRTASFPHGEGDHGRWRVTKRRSCSLALPALLVPVCFRRALIPIPVRVLLLPVEEGLLNGQVHAT